MKTLTAVLFVGGESRRMAVDKATLEFNGEPLWSRQLRILSEIQPDKILVSARSRPAWCPPEIETVLDQAPSCGPVSGLVAVLASARTSHVLSLAVDLPQMESAYLKSLWASCDQRSGIVPLNENDYEPMCSIYPVSALDAAKNALAEADHSLKNLIKKLIAESLLQTKRVELGAQPLFLNLNSPADFSALNLSAVN